MSQPARSAHRFELLAGAGVILWVMLGRNDLPMEIASFAALAVVTPWTDA